MFSLLLTIVTPSLIAVPSLEAKPVVPVPAIQTKTKQLPGRVGQIFIIGNEVTPSSTILSCLKLSPGELLSGRDKAAADRRLSGLRLLGIRAKWSLLKPVTSSETSVYRDILVTVEETWLTVLLLGPRSEMDRIASGIESCSNRINTHCFGKDHALGAIFHLPCSLLGVVYRVAPTSTLLVASRDSILLRSLVHLLIGVPETLTVMVPFLGTSPKSVIRLPDPGR